MRREGRATHLPQHSLHAPNPERVGESRGKKRNVLLGRRHVLALLLLAGRRRRVAAHVLQQRYEDLLVQCPDLVRERGRVLLQEEGAVPGGEGMARGEKGGREREAGERFARMASLEHEVRSVCPSLTNA